MRGRWALLVTVTAAVASDRASAGTCELSRVDRATTRSSTCMACHDGSAGPTIAFQMAPGGDGMSHPVALDYASAAAAHPDDTYTPAALLPQNVLLVYGKVECTSCHDGALTTANHVVEPLQLCYACHRL